MVNYTDAFEKPFTDIKNLLIGTLLSIIPIISWFAIGFQMKCSGVGKSKYSKRMPKWKNFGDLFVKGFFNFAITFIYLMPAAIVLMIGAGTGVFKIFTAIPWLELSQTESNDAVRALMHITIQDLIPILAIAAPFFIIAGILALISVYILPIAVLSYLEKENLSDAFNLKVFKKSFTGDYFIAWLLMNLLAFALIKILGIIPLLGIPAAIFITGVISFSVFGQIYQAKRIRNRN